MPGSGAGRKAHSGPIRVRTSTGGMMARLSGGLLLLFLAVPLLLVPPAECAAKPAPRREDVPLIKCQVCEHVAHNTLRLVKALRDQAAPKKVSELKVLAIVEKVCEVKKAEGDWIQWIDLVEEGPFLELKKQDQKGECQEECKTIQKACNDIMGFVDTDVAELLHVRPEINRKDFTSALCRDITDACRAPRPRMPKNRKPGPAFVVKSEKELEREQMERNINGKQELFAEENPDAPRMPKMKLYSRDDLMKKSMFPGKPGEEEDEEEDEEEEDPGRGMPGQGMPGLGGAGEGMPGGAPDPQDEELRAIMEAMRSAEASKAKKEEKTAKTVKAPLLESLKRQAADAWQGISSSAPRVLEQLKKQMPQQKQGKKAEL